MSVPFEHLELGCELDFGGCIQPLGCFGAGSWWHSPLLRVLYSLCVWIFGGSRVGNYSFRYPPHPGIALAKAEKYFGKHHRQNAKRQTPNAQMPNTKHQMPNAQMPNAQMPNAECQMPNTIIFLVTSFLFCASLTALHCIALHLHPVSDRRCFRAKSIRSRKTCGSFCGGSGKSESATLVVIETMAWRDMHAWQMHFQKFSCFSFVALIKF